MNNNWVENPIFIVGHPKSGTSLLTSLLDGHSELVVIPEETDFYPVIYQYLRWMNFDKMDKKTLLEMVEHIVFEKTHLKYILSGLSGEYIGGNYDYRNFDVNKFKELFRSHLLEKGINLKNIFIAIVFSFKEASPMDKDKHPIGWVEKTPRHEFFAKYFSNWFENAKFIHIIRDPRDNWASYKKKHPQINIYQFIITYDNSFKTGLTNGKIFKNYLLIKYEDLLTFPEKIMKKIAKFIGVEYSEKLLVPSKLGVEWVGNSMWNERFRGITTAPIGRYKKNLYPDEIKILECGLDRVFKKFAYYPDYRCGVTDKLKIAVKIFIYRFKMNIEVKARKLFRWLGDKYR